MVFGYKQSLEFPLLEMCSEIGLIQWQHIQICVHARNHGTHIFISIDDDYTVKHNQ